MRPLLVIFIFCLSLSARADWKSSPWVWACVAAGSIIGVSQLENSETIFAIAYGAGAVYEINNGFEANNVTLDKFIIPMGLTAMALLNLTLLKSEDETPGTIAMYNLLGAGGIAAYWYYFERNPSTSWVVMPQFAPKHIGVLAQISFK